jgi:hypothetical protein
MKTTFYTLLLLLGGAPLMAQVPEDALRMSWNQPSGTARNQAIGGAMGSLGGEISSMFVNPAGLGFFKVSEIVLSPGLTLAKSNSSFRQTDASSDKLTRFNLGTTGFVIASTDKYSKWSSKVFSLAINRVANFNSSVYYKGTNDYSSFSEPLANEFFDYYVNQKNRNPFMNDTLIVNNALNDPAVSLLTKMALYTYLVDVDSANGQHNVISRAELANVVNQENKIVSHGGITEIALGYAANMDDKFYIGGSIGIPIVNYKRTTTFTESDANGNGNNEFNYSTYTETYTSKGAGFNAKLGVIFKPVSSFRLGFAIHSPTIYGLKEKTTMEMTSDLDMIPLNPKVFSVKSSVFGTEPEYKYDLASPWHFLVSGSYVFHEVADVTKQKGFITADIEYVTYGSSRFSSGDDYQDDAEYYDNINKITKEIYKGAFNFRAGGELKFNTFMGRLGFAWYGNPYEDKELKAQKMSVSGGLGYRNKGIFIDLSYVQNLYKDVNFPYRVDAPRLNTFADVKDRSGNILLTLGFKI